MARMKVAKYGAAGGTLVRVEVDDSQVRELIATLSKSEGFTRLVDEKLNKFTSDTADVMSDRAPVDTGHLRDTLRAGNSVKKESDGVFVIQNLTPYGIRQNFEHRFKAGFMTGTINQRTHIFASKMMKAIEEWLR